MAATTAGMVLAALVPATVSACSVCYGQSDSPMAQGLNWGILTLLVVVAGVLAGIASFFVFVAKKAGVPPAPPIDSNPQ